MSQESKPKSTPSKPEVQSNPVHAEQPVPSVTDKEDLSAALHNQNIPVEENVNEEEEVYEDVPQQYTESYGTGVHPQPGQNVGT
jgi:hypothetical protein